MRIDEASADESIVVVRTKLRRPTTRPGWVRRRSLLYRLKRARDAALVLVDAPAGYGKSTLLAQWQAADTRPFAWLSLDDSDNDPVRFSTYLVEAISGVNPFVDAELLGHIRSQRGLRTLVLPRLLNELDASPTKLVVVLDDYHLIRNPTCHELLNFVLENLPTSTQMVISTRADPPLSLGRLRVGGQLFELRAADLRFDLEEANLLVRNVMGRRLAPDQVAELVERAEGWPAGIYLAAMSMVDCDDVSAYLKAFTGDSRILADYLGGEVLRRQPRRVLRFLARTSILERFTASLASEVSDDEDAGGTLQELERSNLFLVPLDDRREWYRYHHLFQQLLQSELQRSEGDSIAGLHRRASSWYREQGSVGPAVEHGIQAGDTVAVRDLIWANLLSYINAGRIETVNRWLSALGQEAIGSDPVLSLAAGWIALTSGRPDEVHGWLSAAEHGRLEGPLPEGMSSPESACALLRAYYGHCGVSEALGFARAAVTQERARSPWDAVALAVMGFYAYLNGSFDEARVWLEEARGESTVELPIIEAIALSELSMLASDLGDRARAEAEAHQALAVAKGSSLFDLPQSSFVTTAVGRAMAHEGNLKGAVGPLEEALAMRDVYLQMSPWPTLQTLVALAPVRFALGDQEGARDLVRQASLILDVYPDGGILTEQVRRLERSLGRPSQRPALFGEPLTDRELSILRLLATPLTHREIGEALFISLNTVKSHVRSLYQKLTVSSRPDAVKKGRELGLL